MRDDIRQDSMVLTFVVVSACEYRTPQHAVCNLCIDLNLNNVTMIKIFGLFLPERERDVNVDMKN